MSAATEPQPTSAPSAPAAAEAPPRPPVRLGVAMFVGPMMWVGSFMGFNAILLPARLEAIAPDQKVSLVAALAVLGSIVALLANIFFGALSDLTRSRFGRRLPWIFVGSLGTFAASLGLIFTSDVTMTVLAWCCFQFFLNAIVAPMITVIPDRVDTAFRGTFSAIYGVGAIVGVALGQIVSSRFVADPNTGMWILALVLLACAPVFAMLAPDVSNADVPRAPLSAGMLLANFSFPVKGARDFYLALSGKLLFMLGTYSVLGYQLYILTDYIGLSTAQAGDIIAIMALITLGTALLFGATAGPLSDRIGRRKILVIGAALLAAIATTIPFFVAEPWAMIAFALIAGIGNGIYNSVDQALNYDVLPDPETAAKDLGIINMANTGGQILGPALTSVIVGLTAGFGAVFIAAAGILVLSAALIKPIRKAR
ncbi:MAG: MFS transporter [Propionicimonas sp.]